MKWLTGLLAFLALLAATVAVAGTTDPLSTYYCNDFSNQWTMSNTLLECYEGTYPGGTCGSGNNTWTLVQDNSGYLSGTVSNYYCGLDNAYYPITITTGSSSGGSKYTGTGSINNTKGAIFYVVSGYPPGGHCALSDTILLPLGTPGCDRATDTTQTAYSSNGASMTAPALLPYNNPNNGETTSFVAFELTENKPGEAEFSVALQAPYLQSDANGHGGGQDSNYSWQGRAFEEVFSGQDGYPSPCYGLGLGTAGTWYMGDPVNTNTKNGYIDNVGYAFYTKGTQTPATISVQDVAFGRLRFQSPSPCGTTATQTMSMDTGSSGGYLTYTGGQFASHTIYIQLTTTLIKVGRGSCGSACTPQETFGWTAKMWNEYLNQNQ